MSTNPVSRIYWSENATKSRDRSKYLQNGGTPGRQAVNSLLVAQ